MTTALIDVKNDFPILQRTVNGHPLVYLDSAATSQKPKPVIDAVADYYARMNSNVHRSVHHLAEEATEAYEGARTVLAEFIAAPSPEEVVFTRGTTESLNFIARGWGDRNLQTGDEIVLSPLEHHSNLIPWQQVARRTGARLRYIELSPDGAITLDGVAAQLSARTRVVTISALSNVLGSITPVAEIAELVHRAGAVLVVDGAQSVPHQPTDVAAMGADFLAFSGHKMCGPTGIGVLWGRRERLEEMDPSLFGGEMIALVTRQDATWADIPARFEGGTPNIAGVVGLAAAVRYLNSIGMSVISEHGRSLAESAYRQLDRIPGVDVYGPAGTRGALVAFNITGVHPHDVAQVFDSRGVAIRAGHHCCQPLMEWLDVGSTARASFYLYNRDEDIDALVAAVEATKRYFRR